MPTPIADGIVAWPAEFIRRYREAGYWAGVPLGTVIQRSADARPDEVAIVDGGHRLTYRELTARADGLATALWDEGLRPGDRIVVQLPNGWEFVVLTLACFRSGIVPVMALPAHRRHELAYLVSHSEARAIAVPDVLRDFDHQQLAHDLRDSAPDLAIVLVAGSDIRDGSTDLRALSAPGDTADRARWDAHPPDPSEVALFLLSGGTTGLPKLIPRSHDDYAYNARRSAEVCGLDSDTVYLGTLPVSHNFPLACPGVIGVLGVGGRVVMLASPEPARVFETIRAEGVTVAAAVPAVAQRWLSHHRDHPSDDLVTLRLLQVGGARIADELARQVKPLTGATLQQVFGMAEGLLNFTRLDDDDEVICTTQGRPMSPDDEVRIVDVFDQDVPIGQAGSLLTRGPYTLRGYYRAEEQNARAFTPDGWYRSGDIVRRRADGNLVVEGRDKDMINRGGEKISAEDVENLAYRIPEISHAAAVAMPDPVLGERVCLYAVVKPGEPVTLERVRASMADDGVAKMAWPERLEIVEELPTTKVGKIDKKALREDIAARLASESA
jgi:2,3-dihydroxybenzoate-AMP ligase